MENMEMPNVENMTYILGHITRVVAIHHHHVLMLGHWALHIQSVSNMDLSEAISNIPIDPAKSVFERTPSESATYLDFRIRDLANQAVGWINKGICKEAQLNEADIRISELRSRMEEFRQDRYIYLRLRGYPIR